MAEAWKIVERGGMRDRLGEGTYWSAREQAVYWVDISGHALNRLSLGDGNIARWHMPERIGWVIERRDQPGLVAGLQSGFKLLDLANMKLTPLLSPEPGMPDNRLNDAKADAAGNIWAGTMPVGADQPVGSFYRLGADRSLTKIDSGYAVTNGPAFSPDGKWLYHNSTTEGLIYRYPFAGGEAGPRSVFIRIDQPGWGNPDGMTVDSEGGLWVALWGGSRITRFTPEGQVDRHIALPASQITNITFAGPKLDRMFVTSARDGKEDEPHAGALFEVDSGATGLLPNLYAG